MDVRGLIFRYVHGMVYDYTSYSSAGIFTYDSINGAAGGYYFEKWNFRPAITPFPNN